MPIQSHDLPHLPESVEVVIDGLTRGIEVAGIAVIVLGALVASAVFARHLVSGVEFSLAYRRYRGNLGRGILLGLELLVAADIIGTVAVEPTFHSLGILAFIVAIRTFLSFSLEVEINGHWPWEESRLRADGPGEKL